MKIQLQSLVLGMCFSLSSLVVYADAQMDNTVLKSKTLLKVDNVGLKGEWIGQSAPDFRLQDQHKKWHTLKDYRGKWLVLYFYPLDDSPGCTEEARQFRDLYPTYQKRNITVLGVSLNDVASHKSFADKLGLPFPLLADNKRDLAKTFKVLAGFGVLPYTKRETFLIDPQGTIVYHYSSVNTQSHAAQVLKDIEALSQVH
ncbi:MAG: peroxiredoxin [Candidatus Saccharibacteria bacterium]|nr:peroxiredoxin [Moraxellaceae bacterium]